MTVLKNAVSFIMAHFLRWFPRCSATGLLAVGNPDENSPVLVTGNYSLTVRRLLSALRGLDVWVLVAQSKGINVWCAAAAGEFTAAAVAEAVEAAALAGKVKHRLLILPALCAPGVSAADVRGKTGFKATFGPVYATDIGPYLKLGHKKTEEQRRFAFGLRHRIDMLVSMNFIIWLPPATVIAIFFRELLLPFSLLFWTIAACGYLLFPLIPGKTVRNKSLALSAASLAGFTLAGYATTGNPLLFPGWAAGSLVIIQAIFFDMGGIVAPLPSDAERILLRRHLPLPHVLREKKIGLIDLNLKRCIGCFTCTDICPLGVFDIDREQRKTILARPQTCFSCGACVLQCPTDALALRPKN